MLAIDLVQAEYFFQAKRKARSEEIAQYFADLAADYQANGFERLIIFLDRNPTHKTKMQLLFTSLTTHLPIQVTFHLMAAYSPKLNLVEYAIHLIRQKILHHADYKICLPEFETYIQELCDKGSILNKEQIINTLEYIESLIPKL